MKRTKTILMAGFVAGTLDALAAILLFARPVNLHMQVVFFDISQAGYWVNQRTTRAPYILWQV
jgi:hypothetical protein